jgi:hypothetical protein
MSLQGDIKFQKALAQAAGASNSHEAEAAERGARSLMKVHNIDPIDLPSKSLYSQMDFADNWLLIKLRDEWRAAHPDYWYGKPDKNGAARRLKHKPRPKRPAPVDHRRFDGLFDDFGSRLDSLLATTTIEPEPH